MATINQLVRKPRSPETYKSTSPALANTSLRHLDARLAGWASAVDAVYTRYADDLTFSGGDQLAARHVMRATARGAAQG